MSDKEAPVGEDIGLVGPGMANSKSGDYNHLSSG